MFNLNKNTILSGEFFYLLMTKLTFRFDYSLCNFDKSKSIVTDSDVVGISLGLHIYQACVMFIQSVL